MDHGIEEQLKKALEQSVWKPDSIVREPEVTLSRWQVFAFQGRRHFVGYNIGGREGRVSSPIQTFDSTTRKGVTASGRVYQLEGPAGHHPDADWVLGRWLQLNGASHNDINFVEVE